MTKTRRVFLPLDDEHYHLIGMITVYYSQMESQLASFIHVILGPKDRKGMIVTSELSISQLMGILFSLYKEMYQNDTIRCENMHKALSKARQATEQRNRIVHSTWGAAANGNITKIKSISKVKSGFKIDFTDYSLTMLEEILVSIEDAICEISILYCDFSDNQGLTNAVTYYKSG